MESVSRQIHGIVQSVPARPPVCVTVKGCSVPETERPMSGHQGQSAVCGKRE